MTAGTGLHSILNAEQTYERLSPLRNMLTALLTLLYKEVFAHIKSVVYDINWHDVISSRKPKWFLKKKKEKKVKKKEFVLRQTR